MARHGTLIAAVCAATLLCCTKGHAQSQPTFVGVRTFLGAPYANNLDNLRADFAVLGVPFDEGTWGWPGERYGPRAMRESSQEYGRDVPVMPTVPSQTGEKITEMVRKIRSKGTFPIVLGGDHSITFPVLRAIDVPVTVLHFDAHLDTWNGAPGNLDHASWVNRAVQLSNVKNVIQLGQRGLANDQEAIGNARKARTTVITAEQIHRNGVEK